MGMTSEKRRVLCWPSRWFTCSSLQCSDHCSVELTAAWSRARMLLTRNRLAAAGCSSGGGARHARQRPDAVALHRRSRRCSTAAVARSSSRPSSTASAGPSSSSAGSRSAALLASLLVLSSSAAAAPQASAAGGGAVLQGPARVVDGDTLYIGSEKIRLYAVDAPEKAQSCSNAQGREYACGQVSLQALRDRVGSNPVRCEVKTKDQYGRNVAACAILTPRGGEDMGTFLVSNGYAVAYSQYGKDYVLLEDKARLTHKGIWAGKFTQPALWRKQQKAADAGPAPAPTPRPAPAPASTPASSGMSYAAAAAKGAAAAGAGASSNAAGGPALPPSSAKCNGPVIKGNINAKGAKVYHTIESPQYTKVEIDLRAGERFFCSEQEAAAAGWSRWAPAGR